jgi:hypothetical protein
MINKDKRRMRIFISYSREDESIVSPIVRLLRVAESKVFLDIDSIKPGDKWEEELIQSLSIADKVCVFWCHHSASSEWVNKEWRYAHERNKIIIPLLLDSTPLEKPLSEYQFIDFRFVEGTTHSTCKGYFYPQAPPEPGYSPDAEYLWVAKKIVQELLLRIEDE